MPRINLNGLGLLGKMGVRLCPILTARNPWTRANTLEAMARAKKLGELSWLRKGSAASVVELRDQIISHKNMTDAALGFLGIKRITFVHINDCHATYQEDLPGENPMSRVGGFVEEVRADNPEAIFTHGGDFYEKGSVAELLSRGKSTREVFAAMGFDVAVIGNHDFAWSFAEVLAYLATPGTKMLASNVEYVGEKDSEYKGLDFTTINVGGVRVGFFGMVSKGYSELDEVTDNDYYPGKLRTRHDYVARAREIVDANRDSVDIMVMLSHIGLKADKKVADEVAGIDVVLSGHSHDSLMNEVVDEDGTIIGQTDAYGKDVIRLDLFYDMNGGGVIGHKYELASNSIFFQSSNQRVAKEVQAIMEKYAPDAELPFAQVSKDLDKPEIAQVAADAAIHKLEADAVLVDIKTVWEEWLPGSITKQALADTFKVERQHAGTPGFNSFYTVDISGYDLERMVNNAKEPQRWVFNGPSEIDPGTIYRLAIQKKPGFHIRRYFVDNVSASQPKPEGEMWEAVYEYGIYRNLQNLHLDTDLPLVA